MVKNPKPIESTEIPNETTLRAIAEVEGMEKDPSVGKTYSDDLLDALFSRFCVGK